MNSKKIFPWFIIIILFTILGFLLLNKQTVFPEKVQTDKIKQVKIAGQTLKVDLALTSAEQEAGLSGREALKDGEGMLFVFKKSGKYPFWMKNMSFPIDIIWIDENFRVIFIKKDAQPESYPEIFTPKESASYVLEVISGFSEKNNLKTGEKVKFLP